MTTIRFRLVGCLGAITVAALIAVSLSGCALLDVVEAKNSMDWSVQSGTPPAAVWAASVKAADDLGITVDSKEFDGKSGEIAGHAGKLDYIRIYVTEITAKATRIDIQARTAVMPMFQSGYDRGFAMTIANRIDANLRHPVEPQAG